MRQFKIETPKGHELVADDILRRIKDSEWRPGQRLPSVVELAEAYGVGRSTIREAASALKAMGWLDVRHGGGTFVKEELPSEARSGAEQLFRGADSLIELLEVRRTLEIGAAALAAERRTSEDVAKLGKLIETMESCLERNDTSEGERADAEFHMAIAAASGNSLFVQLMESLSGRFAGSIRQTRELWFYREQATAARLLAEHRRIYDAIVQRDKQTATELISEHLSKVEQVLREALAHSSER
ncbi:FadR/GntR family transcriptional regulator [Cohnella terricola]|uniref:FadR family transcriptional regulator n=1 Tax=Cohnella terricola TaxID=1289167 RepID=A0A559JC02_9BACL|nr:FadR/GntR family transcriptional regulator [Cohnella terricola]TVX97391.1 FadR family transcriptional regulator [Cohnella terricola]